jgi:hypothetical protein
MKLLLSLLSLASLLALAPGCATTSTPSGDQTAERVGAVVELAAYTATSLHLTNRPSDRRWFVATVAALDALITAEAYNPAALQEAFLSLPIRELKSDKGALIITAAQILYETELRRLINIEQRPYVAAVARHARNGFARALGMATLPPPPPPSTNAPPVTPAPPPVLKS